MGLALRSFKEGEGSPPPPYLDQGLSKGVLQVFEKRKNDGQGALVGRRAGGRLLAASKEVRRLKRSIIGAPLERLSSEFVCPECEA